MRRTRLLSLLGVSGLAAAAGVAIPLVASSAPGDYNLPDLVSVPPPMSGGDRPFLIVGAFAGEPEDGTSDAQGDRLLVRFDGFIDNIGQGPVRFEGNPQTRSVVQRVQLKSNGQFTIPPGADAIPIPSASYPLNNDAESQGVCMDANPSDQKPTRGPCIIYSSTDSVALSDGHNHWHVVNAARYSLWNEAGSAEVAPGQKVGYCMYDSSTSDRWTGEYGDLGPKEYGLTVGANFCQAAGYTGGGPTATSLIEGINRGRRDIYNANLAWQWLDVTNVQPGRYKLGNQVDPGNRIWEMTGKESNGTSVSTETFTVPGFLATAPAAQTTGAGQAKVITLGAQSFGSACFKQDENDGCTFYSPSSGNRRFRIVDPPDNGTLNVATGAAFVGPSVTYTPNPGYNGVDTFSFTAEDANSAYPRTRQAASVSITVGTGAPAGVAISGNPSSLIVGTSAQLAAAVTNTTGGVTWSVNGVPGGNATVGTVSATGLYTAPASVPAGGAVTVRATSTAAPAAFADVVIQIAPAPVVGPQPIPSTPVTPPGGGTTGTPAPTVKVPVPRTLPAPRLARIGGRVLVRVTPRRTGRLAVTVFSGKKRIGSCLIRKATAGRTVVCYVRTPRGRAITKVRVVTVLKITPRGTARAIVTRARL